ncbi:MAG5150 family histidine triad lipoprotein [Mycoplasma sp. HS2188]|uniref:MAG5150 family histidine triad lipoprotein n=1 Tax=Mycoplasma sp. HS2188 TaxID=2976765 RepID=UPI0021AA424E|nr:hypothetical protein [Mycoplasma sp. HS2188]MCT4469783.1 hypothetical protein [Mycoplasma sp. HS2188]
MKSKFLKLSVLPSILTAPFIVVSCAKKVSNEVEMKKTKEISLEFTTLKGIINIFTTEVKKNKEQFYQANPNIDEVVHGLLNLNNNKNSLINILSEITDKKNSEMFLNDEDMASWNEHEKELFIKWFKSNVVQNLLKNTIKMVHDFDIQLREKIEILKNNNPNNEITKFEIYLNQQLNKNFKDSEIIEKIKKLDLFIKNNIYNNEQEDTTEDDHDHNHSDNLQDHTHSHALINIATLTMQEAKGFAREFSEVLKLKNKIQKISNTAKRDFYLNNFYSLVKLDTNFLTMVENAETEINFLKHIIKDISIPLNKMKKLVNMDNTSN